MGVMSFIYAGDPLFHTIFPDTKIAEIFGSDPGPEKLVAQMSRTCGFCLPASKWGASVV